MIYPTFGSYFFRNSIFQSPNLAFALNQNLDRVLPHMLENLIACQTGSKFFYRNGFEVDFIAETEEGLVAIEVKK